MIKADALARDEWYRLSVKLTQAWIYAVYGFSRRNKFQPIGSYMQILIIKKPLHYLIISLMTLYLFYRWFKSVKIYENEP